MLKSRNKLHAKDFDFFILASLHKGFRQKQIAQAIGKSASSVGMRVVRLYQKFGVSSMDDLWQRIVEKGASVANE